MDVLAEVLECLLGGSRILTMEIPTPASPRASPSSWRKAPSATPFPTFRPRPAPLTEDTTCKLFAPAGTGVNLFIRVNDACEC